jgi:hypothetical protein
LKLVLLMIGILLNKHLSLNHSGVLSLISRFVFFAVVSFGIHNTACLLEMSQIRYLNCIQQILDNVPGDSLPDKLNHLSNCNCCQRHQVNKPTIFHVWYETPYHNDSSIHTCMCNCRHVARFICRQADGYNSPPIRSNTPNSIIDI